MTRLRPSGFAGQAGNDNRRQIFLHHADGPLVWRARPDSELVADMARRLRAMNALASEADAIRALSSGPYRLGDVAALAGEALYAAQQAGVAETMARS